MELQAAGWFNGETILRFMRRGRFSVDMRLIYGHLNVNLAPTPTTQLYYCNRSTSTEHSILGTAARGVWHATLGVRYLAQLSPWVRFVVVHFGPLVSSFRQKVPPQPGNRRGTGCGNLLYCVWYHDC